MVRKLAKSAVVGFVSVLLGQFALADEAATIQPVSMNASYFLGDEAPAPIADTLSPADDSASCGACSDCYSGCDCGCGCGLFGGLFPILSCEPSEPWSLPQPCALQSRKIRIGGWLEQGYTANSENSSGFNGPVATNDLASEYQMNQAWMYVDRQADNGGCGFAWGGHIDMMYGTDWRFGFNNGLETRINGSDRQTYGIVIPQAYLELAFNKLSVKLGHFAGILDYEAVPAPLNPFYSHSYGYGYGVPQLVTGALANYNLTDQFSMQAGFHRGWMQFEDNNDTLDFMGGVKWHSSDDRVSLAYALSTGPQDNAGEQGRFVHSFVAKVGVTERLQYILVQNLGSQDNTPRTGQTAEWYGINQYFLYKLNPCWSTTLRAEWFRDDDGMRVAGPGNVPGMRAFDGRGFAGNFYEISAGLNWRPTGNWNIRPEIRYDWFDGPAGPTGLPFGNGGSDDQLTFAVDAVLTF